MESLGKKLIALQEKLKPVLKDGTNPHFNSKYATLSSTIEAVRPLLSELGLSLLQPIIDGKVLTLIQDDKGESIRSEIKLPELSNPQQLGSAITYYRRYTLTSLLALEVEDDDGNGADTPKQPNQTTKKQPQQNTLPLLEFNSENYDKVAKYMQGGGSITEVKKKYTLTNEIEHSLLLLK